MTDRLQVTENARRRFVSDASHELKTPLASIRLLSDSILQTEEIDEATVREFVGDIRSESERLQRITEELLHLTKLDGEPPRPGSAVTAEPVVERVVHMLRLLAEERGVVLNVHLQDDHGARRGGRSLSDGVQSGRKMPSNTTSPAALWRSHCAAPRDGAD